MAPILERAQFQMAPIFNREATHALTGLAVACRLLLPCFGFTFLLLRIWRLGRGPEFKVQDYGLWAKHDFNQDQLLGPEQIPARPEDF